LVGFHLDTPHLGLGSVRWRSGSIGSRGRFGHMLILGIAIVDLLADLLGQGQLHILAGRGSKGSDALLRTFGDHLDLRDGDALLLREIFTGNPGERDWLVDTGLDGLRVDHIHWRVDRGHNGDIVAGLLGHLLAVVVSVGMVAIASVRLADSHHHDLALLLKGDLNSLGSGGLSLGLVRVGADLVINLLNALSADSAGDSVALLHILDSFPAQLYGGAHRLQVGGAHLGNFNNIQN